MPWYQKYRLLLVIYGLCLLVGGREWWLSRGSEPPGWFTEEGRELTEVLVQVNPDEPDTEFLRGMQSLASGDVEAYERFLEEALEQSPKHNDMLLRFHAQHLIDTGADWMTINQALNRWRINHPFDVETINYYIDAGPETNLQLAALEDALLRVRWIERVWLEPIAAEGASQPWRIVLDFTDGAVVDIRDVTRAVSFVLPR